LLWKQGISEKINLCEMKLKRVISGQRDEQSSGKKLAERIAMVTEKQGIVAERWHGHTNLRYVVQILQYWRLQKHRRYIKQQDELQKTEIIRTC
jgi:hypothetical protein